MKTITSVHQTRLTSRFINTHENSQGEAKMWVRYNIWAKISLIGSGGKDAVTISVAL